ncbi:MAG TPA: hypothetical protein QF564_14730 [Pirellulaceae bacterium]|nr:hypothetical protein [Pirellulaceae bacterium]
MPAISNRVVGIVDVEENPDFLLQLEAPFGTTTFDTSPSSFEFFTTAKLTAEIQQLAADLKIEYERYQRQSLVLCQD